MRVSVILKHEELKIAIQNKLEIVGETDHVTYEIESRDLTAISFCHATWHHVTVHCNCIL